MIALIVPSIPIAQPRQRHGIVHGRVRNWTPAKHPVNAFKAAVQIAYRVAVGPGAPLDGPVGLRVTFRLPRPKSKIWKRRPMPAEPHTKKPDLDNLLKTVQDALTGLAWRDDSQVYRCIALKFLCAGDEQPEVRIEINWPGLGAEDWA